MAENAGTVDVLRQFSQKITTSSVKERQMILTDLKPCLLRPDLAEQAIKSILRLLLLTLGRYHDSLSRRTVESIIVTMATAHPEHTVRHLVTLLGATGEQHKNASPCRSNSAEALVAIGWVCAVLRVVKSLSVDDVKKLVEVQILLIHGALASGKKSIDEACYRRLHRLWTLNPNLYDTYSDYISSSPDLSYYSCAAGGCMMRYLREKKDEQRLNKFKTVLLDVYSKQVLGCRSKIPLHVLKVNKDLLRHVTHDDFKTIILPAADKAMLRNPEIILPCLSELITGLNIDLSAYVMDIGRHLATQCRAKEEQMQQMASETFRHLACQCSDAGSVEKVSRHVLDVINGSEGKLTGTSQKIHLLTAMGNLSYNVVSGVDTVQQLSSTVVGLLIPMLQTETLEATLTHLLSVLSLWLNKFTTTVPAEVSRCFTAGLTAKSSTSAVRAAYIHTMLSTYRGDTLTQGLQFVPHLVATMEKAGGKVTQPTQVVEAAHAAALISRLLTVPQAELPSDMKLGSFWSLILDSSKQLFSNDKFLTQASNDVILTLVNLAENLFVDHSVEQPLSEQQSAMFGKMLVYGLTRSDHELRHAVSKKIKRIYSACGTDVMLTLFKELIHLLNNEKLIGSVSKTTVAIDTTADATGATPAILKVTSPRILSEALAVVTALPSTNLSEAERVAMETLIDSHHPIIYDYNRDSWTDLVALMKVEAGQFVEKNIQEIIHKFTNTSSLTQAHKSALSTLVCIRPNAVIPLIIKHVSVVLKDPALVGVTLYDYGIFCSQEGELYDKSVIEGGQIEEKQSNVRRENKLYSYDEQMADQQIRKELEEKKKKMGVVQKEAPKLTKKQQEVMQAQLQKESNIRSNMQQLDARLSHSSELIVSCVNGNSASLRQYLPVLLELLIDLVHSPIAAPHVTQLIVTLSNCAFDECHRTLGLQIVQCMLRLLRPECNLARNWLEEPLPNQSARVVDTLYSTTKALTYKDQFTGQQKVEHHPLASPTFAFCYPLLSRVIRGDGREATVLRCLQIISEHASIRTDPAEPLSETSAEWLPRRQMLETCLYVISTSSTGKLQQTAMTALLDTAHCAVNHHNTVGTGGVAQREIDILLEALLSPAVCMREAALQALLVLKEVLSKVRASREERLKTTLRTWVAKFDVDEGNRKLAEELWDSKPFPDEADLYPLMVNDLVHDELSVLTAAAEGLAAALVTHPRHIDTVLSSLLGLYEEKLYMPPAKLDAFGRVCTEAAPDQYHARCGIAMAINRLAPLLPANQIELLFEFFVNKALRDRKEEVRSEMLKAAVSAINEHGKDNVTLLLPVFEDFLQTAPSTAGFDSVRQSVVILMGTLAKHLDPSSPKIKPIVARLVEALSTPSQQVQEAVANCLSPLVPAIKSEAADLVTSLLTLLLESEVYGERRGAAYGLAGLVKGLGILALKQLNIMNQLTEAIQDKRSPRHREGALFAFEMLCLMLGRLFEPYVVHLLPHLLLCFGDNNQYVREAADDTAKAVMSKLSAHGVKLILPSLLSALEEDSWRTKTGSVELLGAMAFCAPKQLSACLPSIVPKLMEVLTDSHLKVHNAGAQALKQIGSVIRNPEIQAVVPVLLEALQDPTRKTTVALQKLLDTKFVHFIDAPSLALIMPVVQRALDERSTETRKMAAQIIGNMYSLTDQKDLAPYLPTMIPGLKQSLLDPAPEVRSVSARALGTLVRGMGEKGFDELVPWLMATLTSDSNTVDRSGAAQGLSEVVGGLGLDKLKALMPDIIHTANRTDITPSVRDGYIMMYIYLPTVFADDFVPYVGPIIPSILKALADESEFVRETALKAGQRVVNMYAETAVELLLPEVEKGLFDENWRIRHSSVQLLGDLLYRISGVSGKMTTEGADEDDNFGTESCQQAILAQLGSERRDRVLAGLYMGRSDVALMVRQAALHVWKVIVAHTPKMLRTILPTLFELLLGCLASQSYDKRQVAARTLGDIVRKLGEKVLPEIIPILERGLESEDSDQRQGVCIGLSEIMASTSKDHVIVFADSLIPTVRRALCDPLPQVRAAASKTFDNLHTNIGVRALDDIIPSLLKKLEDEEHSEYALDGLKQVMTVKSRVVLPYLVPQLTAPPVNTRALSFLSTVAGDALTKHLVKILPALTSSLADKMNSPDQLSQELQYCCTVILSVTDDLGQRYLIDELLAATVHKDPAHRRAAVLLLAAYCEQTKGDITEYIPQLLKGVIHLLIDTDSTVLEASADCLISVCKRIDTSDMLQYVAHIRQAVRFALSDLKKPDGLIPGFCIPKKGISALIPIFKEGILNGLPEMKEAASLGLGEAIRCTSAEALKTSVIAITGPLIRILGDRFGHTVKVAMLEVICLLLVKCGAQMKPFLPQLQTTFMKALNDPNRTTRLRSAEALGKLITIHTRVDPLFTELINAVKSCEETSVRDTMLQAIRLCLTGEGPKPTEKIQSELIQVLQPIITPAGSGSSDESSRVMAASCLGTLCHCLETDLLSNILSTVAIDSGTDGASWMIQHGRSVVLSVALKEAAGKLLVVDDRGRVKRSLVFYSNADRVQICSSALRGMAYWLKHEASSGATLDSELVSVIAKHGMKHESNEVKQLCAQIMSLVSRSTVTGSALDDVVIKTWVPVLVMGTKEKNAAVKSYSELGLVELLKLRANDSVLLATPKFLEPGMVDSLNEVVGKVLRKIVSQPEGLDEDIDNTLLK